MAASLAHLADSLWPALQAWVRADAVLILLPAAVLLLSRIARRGKFALQLLAAFLAVRLVLFGNPWIWQFYADKLETGDANWRQRSVIQKVRDSYFSVDRPPRYLAVGSSQAELIFSSYAASHPELAVFSMAAMMPLDFVLFREQLARYEPQVILLYLSDFDLARKQPPEAISMAPPQGLGLFRLWRSISAVQPGTDYELALKELLAGELLPEYKYGFVLRGISSKALRLLARRLGVDDATPSVRATRDELIGMLQESISADYIEFNMRFLREFLAYAGSQHYRVVIVEGQYHPDASSPTTVQIAHTVSDRLQALANDYGHVSYLPRALTGTFPGEDYTDLSHVRPEAGYAFTEHLLTILEAEADRDAAGRQ